MEIHKIFDLLPCRHDVDIPALAVGLDGAADLMEEQDFFCILFHGLAELLLLPLRLAAAEIHRQVILGDIPELNIHDLGNGIPDAEAGHQQGSTAADAQQHHHQPLPVAEDIPNGHLVQEAHTLPQRNPLNQQLLPCPGGLGANQLRRNLLQRPMAAVPAHRQHGKGIQGSDGQGHLPIKAQQNIGGDHQDDFIRLPQHNGKHNAAQDDAHGAAQNSAAAGIQQVFGNNGPIAVAQGLQGADLGTLLLHHTGHGGDAHQRRHQQEEGREHPGHTGHNIGVTVQGAIAHIGVPVQHIHLRVGNVLDFVPGILELLLCLCQLRFGVREFLLGLLL